MRILFLFFVVFQANGQNISKINVFLGTSGDHGQLSPGASSPFSMMDVCPQTYPHGHTGYEYKAKEVLGFTHNRMEGVGCMGSGGNLLIKPFTGSDPGICKLIKTKETASPGYYSIDFANGIQSKIAVEEASATEQYYFPVGKHGFFIDLSSALANGFVNEQHEVNADSLYGWIESGTTCRQGVYKTYYCLVFDKPVEWQSTTIHAFTAKPKKGEQNIIVQVAFSSVSVEYAKAAIKNENLKTVKEGSGKEWDKELNHIQVTGDWAEERLFYALLYRTLQSPYTISAPDGTYRATDGSLQHSNNRIYNGWSIWDNYKTQLPLLSLMMPDRYQDMITSITNLYRVGKKDWATKTEPSNTVRTEHAIVVLLDAYRKGYAVDFNAIRDSLLKEINNLDFAHSDKALESSYDTWAMSEILKIMHEDSLSDVYKQKALNWKTYWKNDFQDLGKPDVDKMETRGMYQGTIWQYRWMVPFDVRGLIELCGGETNYLKQLDLFFGNDLYNHANEPDIQVSYMYNGTSEPWKSQNIIRKYAADTVVQYYYNDNSRGIDPFIDRIYRNVPDTYIRTMDDDAGAMSAWYILAACGLSPACVGWPVYYLHVPLFKSVVFNLGSGKSFSIIVADIGSDKRYIQSVKLNGKLLDRNWLTQEEIMNGGRLEIIASATPDKKFGINNKWITDLGEPNN